MTASRATEIEIFLATTQRGEQLSAVPELRGLRRFSSAPVEEIRCSPTASAASAGGAPHGPKPPTRSTASSAAGGRKLRELLYVLLLPDQRRLLHLAPDFIWGRTVPSATSGRDPQVGSRSAEGDPAGTTGTTREMIGGRKCTLHGVPRRMTKSLSETERAESSAWAAGREFAQFSLKLFGTVLGIPSTRSILGEPIAPDVYMGWWNAQKPRQLLRRPG